jgi:hypothetical protein
MYQWSPWPCPRNLWIHHLQGTNHLSQLKRWNLLLTMIMKNPTPLVVEEVVVVGEEAGEEEWVMAPLHLLMATMKSGRRKEIITTEGVGEGGREVEEEGVVATTEAAGVVATAMTMAMEAGVGTTRSRMNTMTSPKNMARPQAAVSQGVAGEEEGRPPGAGVVAVGRHVAAEEATTSREVRHAKVGVLWSRHWCACFSYR